MIGPVVDGAGQGDPIAVIGMAGRFPASRTVEEFWENLLEGRDCISRFTREELLRDGVDEATLQNERFVPAGGVLENIEYFDGEFFGVSPREAESMDPQQRIFLEVVQHAFDDAGLDPQRGYGSIGVFAGSRLSGYWMRLLNNPKFMATTGWHQVAAGNDKDFLATQVSYRFDLRGPSFNIQTACSTSLLAVSLACDALASGQCDAAVAGGASVAVPHRIGYLYQMSGIAARDGVCRPFDADASGSVLGNGVAAVVLKRLSDARSAGDRVYAVIRSTAVNNDGAAKASFASPGVKAQSDVVAMALQRGGVRPDEIDYVEAHGTATALGDPIEVAALARALAAGRKRERPCGIGSVKGNVGHLDPCAGVTSLIKVALALHHGVLPPSIHFDRPNPKIDFPAAGLRVVSEREAWPRGKRPRRAGVSAFGIGGTNVHAILEEAAPVDPGGSTRSRQLLILSAKSPDALSEMRLELAEFLGANPRVPLEHCEFTLACGRREFPYRHSVVVTSQAEAAEALRMAGPVAPALPDRGVSFLFPGQGTQRFGMGLDLYRSEPTFRDTVDEVAKLAVPSLGFDIRELLLDSEGREHTTEWDIRSTEVAQPLLFAIEYATARLWMHWGVTPQGMLGHSIGEFVAASVAGVFSLGDAVGLVCRRGQLMQGMPPGAMLAVYLNEDAARTLQDDDIHLSASNAPELQTLSGSMPAIRSLEERLGAQGVEYRRLKTSHAFHHPSMQGAADQFRDILQTFELSEPRLPFVSNLTGDWITPEKATDPDYWAETITAPVRFSKGVTRLLDRPGPVIVECGPGRALSTIVLAHERDGDTVVVGTMAHDSSNDSDLRSTLEALGQVWRAGVAVDWDGFMMGRARQRVALPRYAFQRKRHWIDGPRATDAPAAEAAVPRQGSAPCCTMVWQRAAVPARAEVDQGTWLVLLDPAGLGLALCDRLAEFGQKPIRVMPGSQYQVVADNMFRIDPLSPEHAKQLAEHIGSGDSAVHLVNCLTTGEPTIPATVDRGELGIAMGFRAPVLLLQALARSGRPARSVFAVTSRLVRAATGEVPDPTFSPALGIARVLPQEMPGVNARVIDIILPTNSLQSRMVVEQVTTELLSAAGEPAVAYRDGVRLSEVFVPVSLPEPNAVGRRLRADGSYLITGGFGGIGGVLARLLASSGEAKITLLGRSGVGSEDDTTPRAEAARQLVRDLEETGSSVLPLAGDVSDPAQIERLVREVCERFGSIHGVIHAAGVPGGGMLISRNLADADAVFAPKIGGTLALLSAIAPLHPDFVVFCSSFAAVGGGPGQGDYCGANIFLDTVAWYARAVGLAAISIDWPAWRDVGMAASMSLPPEMQAMADASLRAGIPPSLGAELFASILAADVPHVIVPPSMDPAGPATRGGSTHWDVPASPVLAGSARQTAGASAPAAGTPRMPPLVGDSDGVDDLDGVLEERLAAVWSQVLGIESVQGQDSFFELGGQSLLALQIVGLVREQFPIKLDLGDIFENPTLSGFCVLVKSRLAEAVSTMSDGEVQDRLALIRN